MTERVGFVADTPERAQRRAWLKEQMHLAVEKVDLRRWHDHMCEWLDLLPLAYLDEYLAFRADELELAWTSDVREERKAQLKAVLELGVPAE